jgi:hypothetical protein
MLPQSNCVTREWQEKFEVKSDATSFLMKFLKEFYASSPMARFKTSKYNAEVVVQGI